MSIRITNPTEVEHMAAAIEADIAECDTCIKYKGKFAPSHGRAYIRGGVGYTYQCRSGCRWYNPATRQMEGRFHCTCDGCF